MEGCDGGLFLRHCSIFSNILT